MKSVYKLDNLLTMLYSDSVSLRGSTINFHKACFRCELTKRESSMKNLIRITNDIKR